AEPYYPSARQGINLLPFRSAWGAGTAAPVYGEIGRGRRARGTAAWASPAAGGGGRRAALLAAGRAGSARGRPGGGAQAPVDLSALWDPAATDRYASKR